MATQWPKPSGWRYLVDGIAVRAKGMDCLLPLAVAVTVSVVVPAGVPEFTDGLGFVPPAGIERYGKQYPTEYGM